MKCNFLQMRKGHWQVCSWDRKVLFVSAHFDVAMEWLNANPG